MFFGPQGDTRWNQQRLERELPAFRAPRARHPRPRRACSTLVAELRPAVIVHTAAQPSHDRAAAIPFDDFDTNAVGTLNLLEAARRSCPESAVRPHEHEQGLRRRPEPDRAGRARRRAGTTPIPRTRTASRRRSRSTRSTALAVRREQGRGRRDGAGIRPLLRHADLLPARRLPDRPEPHRRRAARLPELPGAVQPRGPRVHGLRLQGQAGARQHPLPRRRALHRTRSPRRRASARSTTSAAARPTRARSSRRSRSSSRSPGQPQKYTYVEQNRDRRPHLLLQRPAEDAQPLSRAGTSRSRLEQTIAQIVEAWQHKLVS